MASSVSRDTNINIRARGDQKALIDRASEVLGKSRSEFMLESAFQRAQDVILNQRVFLMAPGAFDQFVEALDAPAQENPRLRAFLQKPAPWDKTASDDA